MVSHLPADGNHYTVERYPNQRPNPGRLPLICGHVHHLWKTHGRQVNVGVDVWDWTLGHEHQVAELVERCQQCNCPDRPLTGISESGAPPLGRNRERLSQPLAPESPRDITALPRRSKASDGAGPDEPRRGSCMFTRPRPHRSMTTTALLVAALSLGLTTAAHATAPPAPPTDTRTGTDEILPFVAPSSPYARSGDAKVINQGASSRAATSAEPDCTMAKDATGPIQLCVTTTAPEAMPQAKAGGVTPNAIGDPLPDECFRSTGQWVADRHNACARVTNTLTITKITNGVPRETGSIVAQVYNWMYTTPYDAAWKHSVMIMPLIVTGEGKGWTIAGSAVQQCGTGCELISQDWFGGVASPRVVAGEGEAFFEDASLVPGSRGGLLVSSWSWRYTKAGVNSQPVYANSTAVRCDAELPGSTPPGCVVYDAMPEIVYSTATLPEFSSHVMRAQASGLPGASPTNSLSRTTDQAIQDANRNTACPSYLDRPDLKSCDEYPFASTYQGASLSFGGARTFDGCQIPPTGGPETGPNGYSRCMISATENNLAGSQLNSYLFVPQRVLDGDNFIVTFE